MFGSIDGISGSNCYSWATSQLPLVAKRNWQTSRLTRCSDLFGDCSETFRAIEMRKAEGSWIDIA